MVLDKAQGFNGDGLMGKRLLGFGSFWFGANDSNTAEWTSFGYLQVKTHKAVD